MKLAIATVMLCGSIMGTTSPAHAVSLAKATADKAGGTCKTDGARTVIGMKNYVCKNISTTKVKKLVWTLAPTLGAPGGSAVGKNGLNGAPGFGPDGDNDHGANNPAMQKAFAAYASCLVKNGGVAPQMPAPRKSGATPGPLPTASSSQVKAEKACASLRPQGKGGHPKGGEFEHQGGEDDDGPGMSGKAAPLVAPSKSPGA